MVRLLGFEVLQHSVVEGTDSLVEMVHWVVLIQNHGGIDHVVRICPEASRPAVRAEHSSLVNHNREDVLLLAEVLFMGSPDLLLLMLLAELLLLGDVHSGEEEAVESYVASEAGIPSAHSERIDLPTDLGVESELPLEELLSNHEVVKNVIIGGNGLVWCTPATTHKVETAGLDKVPDLRLELGRLLIPPHFEVLDLCEGESSRLVEKQLFDRRIQDVPDTTNVNRPVVLTSVEIVDSAEPPLVRVRVRDEMNHLLVGLSLLEFLLVLIHLLELLSHSRADVSL
mmetsp:Transcript_32820/g.50126  ORF Transcript_32820/g.50126 Transcript_32820/m.50126 type:complete len:284 (-) Transcript_32820:941-1792(-)